MGAKRIIITSETAELCNAELVDVDFAHIALCCGSLSISGMVAAATAMGETKTWGPFNVRLGETITIRTLPGDTNTVNREDDESCN